MQTIAVQRHDDGINAWAMARGAASPQLAGLVDGYCDYSERTPGFTTRRELPHPDGVLIINLGRRIHITAGDGAMLALEPGEAFVAGVHLRPALSHSDGEQAGVHVFLPLATLRRLVGAPMHTLIDQAVPLAILLGPEGRRLGEMLGERDSPAERFRLLDAWLSARVHAVEAPAERALYAADLLRRRPDLDIMGVAQEVGWSRKHLADRIHDLVGVGPRSFRRLIRFQRATGAASVAAQPNWAAIAYDAGYADQSHLVREFREFAGLTPTAYRARLLGEGGGLIEA